MAITSATAYAALTRFAVPSAPLASPADRVIYALKLEALPLAYYAFCILRVAIARGGDSKAVMGERSGVSPAMRNLTNTTEQLLLGSLSRLALAAVVQPSEAALVPAAVSLWMTGRLLFAMGYTPANGA